MKKGLRIFGISSAVLIVAAFIIYLPLIRYGFRQLKGQLNISMNATPIDEALMSEKYSDEQKDRMNTIKEAKEFAVTHLDLKKNKNYTKIYDQGSKPVLWIVTGCDPFKLQAYEWKFPVVGTVFYKGFFDHGLAIEEEKRIAAMGFDTDVSPVSAWSTLGFFNDPILSGMLGRGEGRLAELIIHEMTHATIYVESDVDFNENLATFMGEQGAILFLENRYGKESHQYTEYTDWLADKKLFGSYMVEAASRLDSLYNTFTNEYSVQEKAFRKYDLILDIMRGVRRLNFSKPEKFRFDVKNGDLPDNTFFISYLKYRKDQDQFQEELINDHNNDLRKFLKKKKEIYGR